MIDDAALGSRGIDASELPRISIVTPSFNQATFLARTIESVASQRYPDLEYIVMDGGSTDESVEIIRAHELDINYWSSGPDGGQAAAVDAGWRRASGSVLGWVNSDDYLLPGALLFVGSYFASHPNVHVLYGRCEVVDSTGRQMTTIGFPYSRSLMMRGIQCMPQPATFISRAALDRVGSLDIGLRYAMDFDLFFRLAAYFTPDFVDRSLAAFTVHSAAKTTADRRPARAETYSVAMRYAHGRERFLVAAMDAASRVYHSLPRSARDRLDAGRDVSIRIR